MKVTIEIDRTYDELMPDGTDIDDYEKSVKNALVLTVPALHPPDVSVTVDEPDQRHGKDNG